MDVRYYRDADTDLPHIYGHRVTEREVEEVLRGQGEDLPGARNARIKLGQTHAGRYLQVIYVPHEQFGDIFVIIAYDLSEKSKKAFRRRQKRKRR